VERLLGQTLKKRAIFEPMAKPVMHIARRRRRRTMIFFFKKG
jgi:hypothetical protein